MEDYILETLYLNLCSRSLQHSGQYKFSAFHFSQTRERRSTTPILKRVWCSKSISTLCLLTTINSSYRGSFSVPICKEATPLATLLRHNPVMPLRTGSLFVVVDGLLRSRAFGQLRVPEYSACSIIQYTPFSLHPDCSNPGTALPLLVKSRKRCSRATDAYSKPIHNFNSRYS